LLLKQYFWLLPVPLVAVAAFFAAQGIGQLVGVSLSVDSDALAKPPMARIRPPPPPSAAKPDVEARTILQRNAFDHTTGALDAPPESSSTAVTSSEAIDMSDPFHAVDCDGLVVDAITASDDEDWSFASLSGSDSKHHLVRRGTDVAGKTVYFIGWDRVWMTSGASLCQVQLFGTKKTPPPAPVASTSAPAARPRSGAPALAADLKQGIQKISATEYNIDRGVVDKILEDQATLMRQARIVPVQENGKTIGVKLNGVKPDALLGVLGMQNGDTLKTINGFELASPEKALEAYARLRTADKLTISMLRDGKPVNLDYNIK
jgi:general secretion pathway protein C